MFALLLCLSFDPPADALKSDPRIEVIAKGLRSKKPADRLQATVDARAMGDSGQPLARDLCASILDPVLPVARGAADALQAVRPDLHGPIMKIVLDSDAVTGLMGIEKLGADASPSVPVLQWAAVTYSTKTTRIIETDKTFLAMRTLLAVAPLDNGNASLLVSLFPKCEGGAQVAVIKAMGVLGKAKPAQRQALFAVVAPCLKSTFPHIQALTITTLADNFPIESTMLVPIIGEMRFSKNEAVRLAADDAVRKLSKP